MHDWFEQIAAAGAHRVLMLNDAPSGLRAIIALDNLTLGPGCGGIRTQPYPTLADALTDVVKLSRAMTLKCAIANLPAGGAKTVIIDHPNMDRAAAFRALGRTVQDLGGLYRCAGDLGTTLVDLENAAQETEYVDTTGVRLGEATAVTVVNCIRACTDTRGVDLRDIAVAVQGCGLIGAGVARSLARAGARVVVADLEPARAKALAKEIDAEAIDGADILTADVDVVSPCAVGGIITQSVASSMRAWAICGGANNQLATDSLAADLSARDITFVPDYLASSGAVIDGVSRSVAHVDPEPLLQATYETAVDILRRAKDEDKPTTIIAEAIARARIDDAAAAKRRARLS